MTDEEPLVPEASEIPQGVGREDTYPAELLLYTPDEVGEMFGLSKSTIMSLRLSEKWPFHKVGGSILFDRDDILAIKEMGRRTPTTPTRSSRSRLGRRAGIQ